MRFGPCNPSGTRASTRLAPSNGDRTLRLALVLALPTIALEQFLHTDRWTLAALPLYQALHWFSDSLLALPLAAAGVWAGQRSEEHTSELQSRFDLVCRLLLETKN